jgi:hypothetical protein
MYFSCQRQVVQVATKINLLVTSTYYTVEHKSKSPCYISTFYISSEYKINFCVAYRNCISGHKVNLHGRYRKIFLISSFLLHIPYSIFTQDCSLWPLDEMVPLIRCHIFFSIWAYFYWSVRFFSQSTKKCHTPVSRLYWSHHVYRLYWSRHVSRLYWSHHVYQCHVIQHCLIL